MADRGYVLLWRKFWDNETFKSSKPFSEREAWLYLFSNLANGIERNGIPRGQFEASVRYLGRAWCWPTTKVHRFLAKLQRENMIEKVERGSERGSERFSVCKYEVYQKVWNADRNADRNKSNERVNEREKKEHIAASPKRPSASVPIDFKITEEMLTWTKQHVPAIDVESETANFLDHHTAKGSTFRDWTAAWRTWMRNSQKWHKPSYHQETIDEQLERLRRKNDSKPGSVVR